MKLRPTQYAHNVFTINISHHNSKKYTLDRYADRSLDKLTRRTYKTSRFTLHYSLYLNVDFELVKVIYKNTTRYYSIFIK